MKRTSAGTNMDYSGLASNRLIMRIAIFALLLCAVSCKPKRSEQKIDDLARLTVRYINENKPDSVYSLLGETYRKQNSASTWTSMYNEHIFYMLPLKNLSLISSNDSLNVYKVDGKVPIQLILGNLDQRGKINTFSPSPYTETAKKTYKVATDNKLINHLDSIVDKVLSPYIQTKGNVGISAGIFYKGNSYFYNYGERKAGTKRLPDNHTLYDIGSITKTFTSTLLAIAVNQQKLTLETSISKFLPDSVATNPALQKITFKELANHTSGLPRNPDNLQATVKDVNQLYENYGVNDMFLFLKDFKQTDEPGTKFNYSNLGVGLMGVLLERVYDKPYEEILRQYITLPLKMDETVCSVNIAKFSNLAQGYNGYYQPVSFYRLQAFEAAGAIKSSTSDLISYAKAQIFPPTPTLEAAIRLSHQVTLDEGYSIFGLGWYYFPDNKTVITHAGRTGGYASSICIDPTKKIAVVALTNNSSTGHAIGKSLITALLEKNPI